MYANKVNYKSKLQRFYKIPPGVHRMIRNGARTSVSGNFFGATGAAAARCVSPDASYRALPAMGEARPALFLNLK